MAPSKTCIIFSISSDIGCALAHSRLQQGWSVLGTYRTASAATRQLEQAGAELVYGDFASRSSLQTACEQLQANDVNWNELIVAPGTLEPIGPFAEVNFDDWANSVELNFISQLFVVHQLLPARAEQPQVIFFAGAATNGTADNFSAYAISKIALIKMTELLDSEIPDTCFSIIGPGWVHTKIHNETLVAGDRCTDSYQETRRRLQENHFVSMDQVVQCVDWLSRQSKAAVGGRNISVQYDRWQQTGFAELLAANPELGKLRRFGNRQLNGQPEAVVEAQKEHSQ